MANYNLGSVHGRIEIDYDGTGVSRADRDVDRLTNKSDSFSKKLNSMADSNFKASLKMAKGFGLVVGSMAALGTGLNLIGGALGAVKDLSGVIGLLPAAGMAAAAGIGALAIGTMGFMDALKDMGDAEKFEEALKNLSPAAAATARAIKGLTPEFKSLQQSVQENLFKGMASVVEKLSHDYIPLLKTGLSGVASELNRGGKEAASFFGEAQTKADFTTVMSNNKTVIGNLINALRPLLQAFRDIGVVGSKVLADITGGAGGAAQKFADFIAKARESGQLENWILKGVEAFKSLIRIVVNVAHILGSIFDVFNMGNGGFLATIESMTFKLRTFLESAKGQQFLKDLMNTLTAVSGVVRRVFMAAIQELGPILKELAPVIAEVAKQVGDALVVAVKIAGPLILGLAKFLAANKDIIVPLAVAFIGLSLAMKATSMAINGFNSVSSTLSTAWSAAKKFHTEMTLLSTRVGLAKLAINDFGAKVGTNMGKAGAAFGTFAANTGRSIGTFIANMVRATGAVIANAAKMIATMVATAARYVAQWVVMAAGAMARALVIAAAWLIANPWLLIAAAIVALVVLIIANWDKIKNFLIGAWNAIKAVAIAIWDAIKAYFQAWWTLISTIFSAYLEGIKIVVMTVLSVIKTIFETTFNAIKIVIETVWNVIKVIIETVLGVIQGLINVFMGIITGDWTRAWEGIKQIFSSIWNGIKGIVSAVWEGIKALFWNALNGVRDAVVTVFNGIIDWFRAVPGRIIGALGDFGSMLFNIGKSIIEGLWHGIENAAKWLWDKIKGIANGVKNAFAAVLDIFSPSGVFEDLGKFTVQGYVVGLDKNKKAAYSAITTIASNIVAKGEAGITAGATAASSSTVNNYGATVEVNITNNNPVAESGSDSAARNMRTLTQLGAFG